MSNSKTPAAIKQEPKVTPTTTSLNHASGAVKKQVQIKFEPTLITSTKRKDPITPIAKIVDKPHENSKGHRHKVNNDTNPVTSTKDKLSSKFYLKNIDFDDDANITKPLIHESLNSETPTRKRSKSQEQKERLLKKVRAVDIPSTPITPITPITNYQPSLSPATTTSQSNVSREVLKPPVKFQPIKHSLIDSPFEEFDKLKHIFYSNAELSQDTKKKYMMLSKMTSNDWISKGFENANKNYELLRKVIIIRFELSLKFDKIFDIINRYGEHLEKNDEELNEKMQRLQKLGEEIKKFIK